MITRFVITFNCDARLTGVCVCIIAFYLKFTSVFGRHKNKPVIPSILGEPRLRADRLGLTLYSLCAGFNNNKSVKAINKQRADYERSES